MSSYWGASSCVIDWLGSQKVAEVQQTCLEICFRITSANKKCITQKLTKARIAETWLNVRTSFYTHFMLRCERRTMSCLKGQTRPSLCGNDSAQRSGFQPFFIFHSSSFLALSRTFLCIFVCMLACVQWVLARVQLLTSGISSSFRLPGTFPLLRWPSGRNAEL